MMTSTPNVDPDELEKFERIAHKWWDRNSEFKPLHDINPLRLLFVERAVGGLHAKRVLDVGCGGGIFAEALARAGATVTGIDLAEKSLRVAQLHLLESGLRVHYVHTAVEAFAADFSEQFEVVTCLEMLEHTPDPASVVLSCAKLVKPGGTVCFSTINRSPKAYFMAILGAEYMLNMIPRGTHDYARFLTPAELSEAARRAGLSVLQIQGLRYHPFSKQYTLTDDPAVNYFMACRKP